MKTYLHLVCGDYNKNDPWIHAIVDPLSNTLLWATRFTYGSVDEGDTTFTALYDAQYADVRAAFPEEELNENSYVSFVAGAAEDKRAITYLGTVMNSDTHYAYNLRVVLMNNGDTPGGEVVADTGVITGDIPPEGVPVMNLLGSEGQKAWISVGAMVYEVTINGTVDSAPMDNALPDIVTMSALVVTEDGEELLAIEVRNNSGDPGDSGGEIIDS